MFPWARVFPVFLLMKSPPKLHIFRHWWKGKDLGLYKCFGVQNYNFLRKRHFHMARTHSPTHRSPT